MNCGKELSRFSNVPYCSDCAKVDTPRCSTCNSPLVTVKVSTGLDKFSKLRGIDEYLTAEMCKTCMKVTVRLDLISDGLMSVFVGRVVRVDRERYGKRIVQIPTSYPEEASGKILRFSFYHPIRRGDRVAIAGQPSTDWIEPILIRNLSAGSEKIGGSLYAQVLVEDRKNLKIANPLVMKAQKQIDAALKSYEEQLARIVTRSSESRMLSPSEFEMLVADLFERLSFQNVMITGGAGDKGVDIEASRVEEGSGKLSRIIVQCAHQSMINRVMPTQVRDFAHTIEREKKNDVCRGYFVTSSYFSPECFDKENCGDDMELIDRDQLELLLKKAGLPFPELR